MSEIYAFCEPEITVNGQDGSSLGMSSWMETIPDESDLIQSARGGNLAAFNRLVLTYQDRLYGWVFSLVKDESLADDLTQAAFILAYEKLNTFRGGSFRAWLFKIGRNLSFDELRRKKRHPWISLDEPLVEGGTRGLLDLIPDPGQSPEWAVEKAEQAAWVNQLLQRLPEGFQQALRLVDMEGMDYQEAAEVLGLPLGTVKSRVSRARWKFRSQVLALGAEWDLMG